MDPPDRCRAGHDCIVFACKQVLSYPLWMPRLPHTYLLISEDRRLFGSFHDTRKLYGFPVRADPSLGVMQDTARIRPLR